MEGVIHTDITHQWALTENCLPSENYQPIYSTSKIPQPVKDPIKERMRWWRIICRSRYLLDFFYLCFCFNTVLIFNETRLIMPVNSLCEEHVSAVNRIAHGLSVSDWWMCSWACVAGQRLRGWGSAAQFPLRSHKTSTSEDTAAERCRPPAAILLNPPRTRTSLTSPFPSHMLSKHFSVH